MTAVNPLRGEATLEAGDRGTLMLCYDANAFCYAEERLGKTTDEIVATVATEFADWGKDKEGTPRINSSLLRALLWAGLQKHHGGTHMAEAGEIMSDVGLAPAINAVLTGFFAAFGSAEDKDSARPPKAPRKGRGTG